MKKQSEGNYDFISSGRSVKNITPTSINEVKDFLTLSNINIRK